MIPLSDSTKEKIALAKTPFEETAYYNYIDSIRSFIQTVDPESRQKTNYGNWEISRRGTYYIFGPSELIENDAIYCNSIITNIVYPGYGNNSSASIIISGNKPVLINGNINAKDLFYVTVSDGATLSVDSIITHNYVTLTVENDGALFANSILMSRSSDWYGSGINNYGSIFIADDLSLTGNYDWLFGAA